MIYLTYEDIEHTILMVLNDNRGQQLTEALTVGVQKTVEHYLRSIEHKPTPEIEV